MTQRSTQADQAAGQLVAVSTRFHEHAVRSGGVGRSAALERAEEVLTSSRGELDKRVFAALDELTYLAAQGADATLKIRQQARELRDLGELAGFPIVTAVAAMLADVLSGSVENRLEFRPDVVNCYVDSIKVFCTAEKRELSTLEFPRLLDELREMQDRLLPESEGA